MKRRTVGFICVHNSCRSQMAEALAKYFSKNVFDAYSAGTEIKAQINPDATRILKKRFGIDMELTQHSKLIDTLPALDIVITMGCNVECPNLPCKYREDWGLDDPSGKDDDEFNRIIDLIAFKIKELEERITLGIIELN